MQSAPRRHLARRALEKPSKLYKIRTAVCEDGERIPLIVDAVSGLPLVSPNQYVLRARRASREVATMEKDLRNIGVLFVWAEANGIDLESRLRADANLSNREIDNLIDAARLDLRSVEDLPKGVRRIAPPIVSDETWAARLLTIRDYLVWHLDEAMSAAEFGSMRYQHLRERRDALYRKITSRIPITGRAKKKGLEPQLLERLWSISHPDSEENPFQPAHRRRNQLIVEWLSKLGFRRGELLKIRTSGTTTARNATISVTRERDDVEDPRRHEPRTKTLSRTVPIDDSAARMADRYLETERSRIPGAKRTPFLFVARNGRPLTLSGLREVLRQIVHRHPEFKGKLSPHALRRTAADLLWGYLQDATHDDDERTAIFNYLMGWTADSKQSQEYARGEIERRATKASLGHQRRLFSKDGAR